jgi:flagellar basal body rod protein FlgG
MDPSFFGSASSIYYGEQSIEHKTNNVANKQTPAYRGSQLVVGARQQDPAQKRRMHRSVRSTNPQHYAVAPLGIVKDFSPSKMYVPTNNPMDVAIGENLPNAFFAVRSPDDTKGEVLYTRYGKFSVGPMDPLNPDSPAVLFLGRNLALDANFRAIPVEMANGPLRFGAEGQLFQKEEQVADVPVYIMHGSDDPMKNIPANLQKLEQRGDMLFAIPEASQKDFFPKPIQAGINSNFLKIGVVEGSNVETMYELADLLSLQKLASANRTAISGTSECLTKFFEVVRSG